MLLLLTHTVGLCHLVRFFSTFAANWAMSLEKKIARLQSV